MPIVGLTIGLVRTDSLAISKKVLIKKKLLLVFLDCFYDKQ